MIVSIVFGWNVIRQYQERGRHWVHHWHIHGPNPSKEHGTLSRVTEEEVKKVILNLAWENAAITSPNKIIYCWEICRYITDIYWKFSSKWTISMVAIYTIGNASSATEACIFWHSPPESVDNIQHTTLFCVLIVQGATNNTSTNIWNLKLSPKSR